MSATSEACRVAFRDVEINGGSKLQVQYCHIDTFSCLLNAEAGQFLLNTVADYSRQIVSLRDQLARLFPIHKCEDISSCEKKE